MPEFEWDEKKNKANIEKHGISFETASRIFDGTVLTWLDDRKHYGEIRKHSIGMIEDMLVVAVIHTDRNENIRIISARSANTKERKCYEEKIQ